MLQKLREEDLPLGTVVSPGSTGHAPPSFARIYDEPTTTYVPDEFALSIGNGFGCLATAPIARLDERSLQSRNAKVLEPGNCFLLTAVI